MTLDLKKYQKLLELDEGAQFIKIDHADAMVADVYKIERRNKLPLILKICERLNDYASEVYFLQHFAKKISVPDIMKTLPPNKENYGAVLMEYLPGNLLTPELITKEIAFELGKVLATIKRPPCLDHYPKKLKSILTLVTVNKKSLYCPSVRTFVFLLFPAQNKQKQVFYNPMPDASAVGYKIRCKRVSHSVMLTRSCIHLNRTPRI